MSSLRLCESSLIPLILPISSSLLKEAEIHAEQREFELNRRRQMGLSASHHSLDNIEFDNKEDDQHDQRLLSQFGIWFLVCNHRLSQCLSITRSYEIRMCAVHGLLSLPCWIHGCLIDWFSSMTFAHICRWACARPMRTRPQRVWHGWSAWSSSGFTPLPTWWTTRLGAWWKS